MDYQKLSNLLQGLDTELSNFARFSDNLAVKSKEIEDKEANLIIKGKRLAEVESLLLIKSKIFLILSS